MGLGFRVYTVAGVGLGLRWADTERPGMVWMTPGYFAFIMHASRAFIHPSPRESRRRARRGGRPKTDRRRPKTTDVMTVVRDVALTDQEAAVYDRQILRLGRGDAARARAARVLVSCGRGRGGARARGLCAETLKNVVLAGVGEMTIRDDAEEGSRASFGTDGNFLNHREDAGRGWRRGRRRRRLEDDVGGAHATNVGGDEPVRERARGDDEWTRVG